MRTSFLTDEKKSMSEIGAIRYERSMLKRSPLGGSLVIFTPFCRIDTGNDVDG